MTEQDGQDTQRIGLTLDDLPAGLLERIVAHLCAVEPAAIGVLATGSYAAGRAGRHSDLDLTVLTAVAPQVHYRTWFEACLGVPLHVSAGARALHEWVEEGQTPAEWALGFPTEEVALWVWATAAARAVLGDPPIMRRPPASPELEDFLECATKVKRASANADPVGARWHAHRLGCYAPRLLRPLNPPRPVTTTRDALQASLDLEVAPAGYRDDLIRCLGLCPVGDDEVASAAHRLAAGILAFLREHKPDVDPQPDLARYLADGTLERHLSGQC
jgi:phosphoribosyl-AMP cyclohydrolase